MNTLPCPEWCTADHDKLAVAETELRNHTRTIDEVHANPDERVTVEVEVYDDLTAGTRGTPQISMWWSGYGDALTAAQARQLAGVLLRAADFLDGVS